MSSLTHLREKHHQMWSQVPSWTITQTSIDAAEEAKLHSSEVAQLQQTLHNAAASLDEVKIKLADTSREKEEVISQLAQLQQECTKLHAQVCDLERRTSPKEGENEEGNNNNNDNNNADVENKTVETDASPHHSSAVTLLRSQNEKLLEQVESLTRHLHNNNNENHQNEDAAEKSQIQNSILSRFLNIASQNQQEHEQQQQKDGEGNLQETIRRLRHQLAFAEERALIAERVSARATAESTSQQNNNNNNNNKSVDGSTCSSPKNRPQKSQLDDNDEEAAEDANNEDDINVLPRRRQRPQQQGHVKSPKSNFASTCELETLGETNADSLPPPSGGLHSTSSSSDVTLPKNQTELMRFWTFGQRQISKLKQEVAAANTRVDHVSMKAQASESLARSRSELIQNIQSLAGELEASRDECSRMRIDVEAKETENSILAAHLANALAAAMSHDEIQRCAGQLREAAQKTATIAAMTAPEMSVAKDAMKKNQALQHELKLMAKRRDDLNEEIVSKQRMLEDMASHSWLLKHTSANDDDDGEDDANNRKGGAKSNAASDASSLFHSNLFGVSQAVIAVFNSATTKFQDQIHQQELQLAEKENIIFELEKRLACSYIVNGTDEDSAVAINNHNNVDDDEITNNDNSTTFLSLRQDTTITALKQKLHSARSRITQQNIFIETSIAVIGDVSGLVNNLMKLLDSLLSSHALFGNNNTKNLTHQEQGNANNNSNNNQNNSEDSASSSSLMTPEERAVITKVLSVLEEHKNLVNERLSLIEMFKKLGENSEEISACSTLEKRVLELSESKKQVSELMKKLEDVQKENAEQSSWYGVVEKGIAELKQQGEDLERENISAWSLFSEIALQKLDAGVKEQITGAKPAIPAVVAASFVVASNSNVDGAKEALQKSVELLSGK